MPTFKTETELARVVVAWLKSDLWDVYQEVEFNAYSARADIVAVRDGIVWVIETKRSLTLDLFGQAADWVRWAHYVSVAVPTTKSGRRWDVVRVVTRHYGVGALCVSPAFVNEQERPRLNRRARAGELRAILKDEHKTFAEAGNANGARFTAFAGTCRELHRFVADNPGCTLKRAIESVPHHYSSSVSARSSMAKWLRCGKVPGVRYEINARGKAVLFTEKTTK